MYLFVVVFRGGLDRKQRNALRAIFKCNPRFNSYADAADSVSAQAGPCAQYFDFMRDQVHTMNAPRSLKIQLQRGSTQSLENIEDTVNLSCELEYSWYGPKEKRCVLLLFDSKTSKQANQEHVESVCEENGWVLTLPVQVEQHVQEEQQKDTADSDNDGSVSGSESVTSTHDPYSS